jgi:Cu+-exporting ATPase
MSEIQEIEVEGMTCANCALGVKKGLEKLGLQKVNVDFASGEVNFENIPELKPEEIQKQIEKLGYSVRTESPEDSESGLSKIEKKFYFSLIFTIPLFAHMFLPFEFLHRPLVQLALSIPVVSVGLIHFGKSAFYSLKNGMPNMDVLIFIGSTSAFIYSLIGTFFFAENAAEYLFYETAATIITLVLLGNVLEHRSVKKTSSAIGELSKLKNPQAKRINAAGEVEIVDANNLRIGDLVQLNEGDRVPVDGKVKVGAAYLDEAMLTGESEAIHKEKGNKLIGGTILQSGNLQMTVSRVGEDTILAKIIELVKKARSEKPEIQRLGDKVSAVFVPVVIGIALITFASWMLFTDVAFSEAMMNAIAVLVISCPCAMGLATPTAVMVGVGRAAKEGILIKGGATIEEFAKIKRIVFDKTGTLTKGQMKISTLKLYADLEAEEVESIIYSMEQFSSHPIARSLSKELKGKGASSQPLMEQKEEKGKGISAKDLQGNFYQLGSKHWLADHTDLEHSLFLFKDGTLVAGIDLDDELRDGVKSTIATFKSAGINTQILSGDRKNKVEAMAKAIEVDGFQAEMLPEDKIKVIKAYSSRQKVAMVGDGINDAPALNQASVGVSLSDASEIAMQSAQVILLKSNDLNVVFRAFKISEQTLLTIKQNLFWAFFYNVVAIPLAAFGFLSPMIAALSMAFSDVIVIGNSLRLRVRRI